MNELAATKRRVIELKAEKQSDQVLIKSLHAQLDDEAQISEEKISELQGLLSKALNQKHASVSLFKRCEAHNKKLESKLIVMQNKFADRHDECLRLEEENKKLKEALKDRKEVVATFRQNEKRERWYAMQLQWAEGRIDGLRKDVNRIQKERNDLFANILSSAMVTDYELELSLLRQVIRGHEKAVAEFEQQGSTL